MTKISQLNAVSSLSAADQIVLNSAAVGDDARAAVSVLQAYMQASLTFASDTLVAQYAAPLTGTTVVVDAANKWLILIPAGTIAALTITLPAIKNGGQEVLVCTTQTVTALTVGGAGSTVSGAPTTLAAGAFFRMKYDAGSASWYRVG